MTSRRSFVKRTAAAGLCAATAPTILPNLYAQEKPSNQLNVGAIGVGGRGSGIADQAGRLGKLVAVCDVMRPNAERFAKQQSERGHNCEIFTDYREMFEKQKDIDVVTIGTPDHWHVKIAIEAMKAGKHVYCEKPLTMTIAEGQLIQEAVKKYGKTFQVGTQQRSEFEMRFLKAVAIAQSGRLGTNLEAVSSVGKAASRSPNKDQPFGPFPTAAVPEGLDWDLWLGPAPKVDFCSERIGWNFRWWFEYSGGQVTDWGVHHTDIAFWALAGADGQAVQAEGSGDSMAVPRDKVRDFLVGKVPAEDMPHGYNTFFTFDVDIKLSTGNVIKLVSGDNQLLISGERGRIRVNRERLTGKPVEEIDADPKAKQEIEELMAKLYGGSLPDARLGHMSNFFECVKSGKQPVANVKDHVRAVNACHLANIALLTGRKVTFDPSKQQFVDDAEANKLINREKRSGYGITV